MAQNTTLNGVTFSIPEPGDTGWAANLTAFLLAISPAVLQKSGGAFTLTSDIDFGSANGLRSSFFASRNSNPATAGIFRLSNNESIAWRNALNNANLLLTVDGTNTLMFNGAPIGQFSSTANRAVITNGSGILAVSPTTAAELAFVSGVTSAIQTQLDAKELLSNKSTDVNLGTSNTLYPTQNAVKTYVDNSSGSVFALGYRRPNLTWISVTTVDIENNTGTANQTTIVFPDGSFRSVTENTASTSKYRRFIITETAEFTSGTENSGLRSGLSETNNTWYAIYAIKSQINGANFVLAGDTTLPLQANFATLNSRYGTNSWLYLGMIRNGDNLNAPGDILDFTQTGPNIQFNNPTDTADGQPVFSGMFLVSGTGTASYATTFGTGATDIPNHTTLMTTLAFSNQAVGSSFFVRNSASTLNYAVGPAVTGGSQAIRTVNSSTAAGIRSISSSNLVRVWLVGLVDAVLSVGVNQTL